MEFSTIKFANWLAKLDRVPNIGDTRIRSAFLLLPKIIDHKGKWLVKAKWEEYFWVLDTDKRFCCKWKAKRWC